MPARRDVLPLGNLCIEVISQLLVDIIEIFPECNLTKSEIQSPEIINTKDTQEGENSVPTDPEQSDHNQNGNTESEESTTETLQNENTAEQKKEIQQSLKTRITVEDKKSHQNENAVVTNEPNNYMDSISEKQNYSTDHQSPTESKEEKQTDVAKFERLDSFRKELINLLTSHCHVQMHGNLFSAIVARFSDLYMTKKSTRPLIQEMVPLFINSSLREMDFGKSRMFSEAAMCKILFDHLDNAPGLNKLDIGRSCYWRLGVFENLNVKLKSLPLLKVLRIQYICTPEMISGLVDNCPELCELNLKGSEKITDGDCDEIAKCNSLQSLDITGTRITGKGCWRIIDSIKSLSWLQHCAFNCNSDALLFESRAHLFHCIKEQVTLRDEPLPTDDGHSGIANVFNLKNFWLFNPCTTDLSSMLLCPHLEHLRLDFIFQDLTEEPEVEVLSVIPKLTKLQANLYDRCVADLVTQMIEGCGSKLTVLDLLLADDYFFAAQIHNVVARCCPNLITLRFSGDYMADSERVFRARHSLEDCDNCLDFDIEAPAHPFLEHLSITGVVSDSRLRFMLSHTPSIQTLTLDGELEWVHDDTFKALLDTHTFLNLEYVWFNVSTTITLNSVRMLLLHDNSIRTIGRLCHFAEATMNEYQELQDLVRQNNLDVKLIWVTDERNR